METTGSLLLPRKDAGPGLNKGLPAWHADRDQLSKTLCSMQYHGSINFLLFFRAKYCLNWSSYFCLSSIMSKFIATLGSLYSSVIPFYYKVGLSVEVASLISGTMLKSSPCSSINGWLGEWMFFSHLHNIIHKSWFCIQSILLSVTCPF